MFLRWPLLSDRDGEFSAHVSDHGEPSRHSNLRCDLAHATGRPLDQQRLAASQTQDLQVTGGNDPAKAAPAACSTVKTSVIGAQAVSATFSAVPHGTCGLIVVDGRQSRSDTEVCGGEVAHPRLPR